MSRDLTHGGALDAMGAAYPQAPQPWIDLSTGINPWPYGDTAISGRALANLPTAAGQAACRRAMAAAIGAPAEALVLTPGSELAIRLLPGVIAPRRVALLRPTYGDHGAAWRRAGAALIETEDPLALAGQVDAVVLAQPNNPDGRCFEPGALEAARRALASRGGFLILDEAFADLDPGASLAGRAGADGLIILRSFGKFYGLAGLRLGAVLAPAQVRRALAARLGAWPVSGAALEIGARAYGDAAWQAATRRRLGEAASRLDEVLEQAGLALAGGTSLFRYARVARAHDRFRRLAEAGIYVRRFAWSQHHLRIGLPASAEAEARLVRALSP
ncbi:MAG: threonine-phosphate decarboxylase CobD [Pseudomonadota bacterium]